MILCLGTIPQLLANSLPVSKAGSKIGVSLDTLLLIDLGSVLVNSFHFIALRVCVNICLIHFLSLCGRTCLLCVCVCEGIVYRSYHE